MFVADPLTQANASRMEHQVLDHVVGRDGLAGAHVVHLLIADPVDGLHHHDRVVLAETQAGDVTHVDQTGHVARQQVGRTLHPFERTAHALSQRPGQHRLGHAGNVFQQNVFTRQKCDRAKAEDIALADIKIELMFPADAGTRAALMAQFGQASDFPDN